MGAGFAREVRPGVVALSGELGAGKTTFSQGILAEMGATGPFTSPTFVLMKQYNLSVPVRGIERIYHVDAYRVGEEDLRARGLQSGRVTRMASCCSSGQSAFRDLCRKWQFAFHLS